MNTLMSSVAAALNKTTLSTRDRQLLQIYARETRSDYCAGCATEAFNVARARGIHIDFDDPVDYVYNFGAQIPDARPSMLLDHLDGRPSEIDAINGAIPKEGEKVGVPTPFNTVVSALVRVKERRLGLPVK